MMDLYDKIEKILNGIDKCETDSINGWWGTSEGAEFGSKKLEEIKESIRKFQNTNDIIEFDKHHKNRDQ